jgi:tetratricopeptide (TPR) repeat protein
MGIVRSIAAVLAAALWAAPAAAQEQSSLGSGMTFTGAPSMQEIIAQQKACEAKKPPRKSAGALSEGTYRRIERAMNDITKNQYAEAEQKLNELLQQGSRSDYEKAIILQTLGFVYASTKREMQSIKVFEQAIATNALPQPVHEQMLFNIAQLYFADDKWDQGMQRLSTYLAESCNPTAEAHILLASGHVEKKQWNEALKQVDLALVKSKAPKESWLQVKLAVHNERKEYARCAEVLVHLIGLNPIKEEYFKQLHGILMEIQKDPEALAVLALTERRGFLDQENEYRNLAAMYLHMQVPLKAATILERGLAQKHVAGTEKNYEMLGNAYLAAREYDKSEKAMLQAAQASDGGELYKRLGQIQIANENWKGALDSLQKAQKKGGLKDPGETAFLVGVAAVNLKQWKTAEAALRQAMQHEKTAKMASEWLSHLQAEYAYSQPTESTNGSPEPQTN